MTVFFVPKTNGERSASKGVSNSALFGIIRSISFFAVRNTSRDKWTFPEVVSGGKRSMKVSRIALIGLVSVFFLWVFFPDFVAALWATIATVVFGYLVIDLSERRTTDRRARSDLRVIAKTGDRRRKRRGRRQDDNVWA
jgi:hypothetical protein